jgi:hypothetical protein
MVELSATRCSGIATWWVSIVGLAAISLCVASQRVFIVVSIYFVTDSVRKLLDTPSYYSLCGGLLWLRLWTFGFHKRRVISWLAVRLLASQEGLWSMELRVVIIIHRARFLSWSLGYLRTEYLGEYFKLTMRTFIICTTDLIQFEWLYKVKLMGETCSTHGD